MKKKLTAILLCLLMAAVSGCGSSETADASADASADTSDDTDTSVEKPDYDPLDYVELGDYMGLEVTSTVYSATQEEYEEEIENILESESYYAQSDKTEVEDGDLVNIDYVGEMDGEEFDGGSSEDYELEIGSGTFIDDFEDQLIGASVGDVVEVNVTFPDDYSSEDLAGQDATFTVTINYICESEATVPEYTDDFINEYTDGTYTTTEAFDEYVWDYLEDEAAETTQSALEAAVQEAVIDVCVITGYPDGLVDYYVSVYLSQDEYYAEYYGLDLETYIYYMYGMESEEAYEEYLEEEISDGLVPIYLIQEAIIEAEELEVTDEAIESFMLAYAEYYSYDDIDSLLSAFGVETTDEFIELVGEESFNTSVLDMMVWDMIEDAAVVTYVEDGSTDETSDTEDTSSEVSDDDSDTEEEVSVTLDID